MSHAVGVHTAEEAQRYRERGDWQERGLYDLLLDRVEQSPEKVFVSDGDVSFTYAELRDRAVRLAAGLRQRGVGPGDRVACQLPNWSEFAVVAVAVARLGAVLVPIMPIYRLDEVRYTVQHAGVVALLGPTTWAGFDFAAMYAEIAAEVPALRNVVAVRGTDGLTLEAMCAEGDLAELDAELGPSADPDAGALIVYTSGTTARPKGCHHSFNTVYASSIAMCRRLGVTADDVFFNPSPVTHSTGLVTGLLMPLIAGGSTHFQPKWEPAEGLRRIAEHGCTITYTATVFLTTLMAAYDPQQHDLSSMRYWVCAGAPIPGAVVSRARATFPSLDVLSLYGRSENMTTTMCRPEDPAERSTTSDGLAIFPDAVVIVDDDGAVVGPGVEGDIAFRGPSHMLGYYRQPVETDELFTPDGWSRSGDLGRMDPDGYVRVTGRVKDIIIRGGLNISSREVEELLGQHPKVADVAVVAMPDERLGERACAYVVPVAGEEPPTLAELNDHLRAVHLAVQKLPERLELTDALPMTAVGKVRKNLLRDDVAAKLQS